MNKIIQIILISIVAFFVSCSKDESEGTSSSSLKDIYICGDEYNGTKYVAKLWKNGIATNLSDGTKNCFANAVTVVGEDSWK